MPGQLAKKPLSVWAVQGILALGIVFMFFVFVQNYEEAIREPGPSLVIFFTIMVQMGLLVGIQLRQQWARWITAAIFLLSLIMNVVALSGNTGSRYAGNVVGALVALAIVARFAFGAPARRYFAKEMVS